MKVLFIGDVIGKLGRKIVKKILPEFEDIDFVVINGENLAHGIGVTMKTHDEMSLAGVDGFTSGNHVWEKREFIKAINQCCPNFSRPANYPEKTPGKEYVILEKNGHKLALVTLVGRVFIRPSLDCPFRKVESILKEINKETNNILVDFHAEATSEKKAMGYYLDGKVSAMVGTHTHIQTADEEVLDNGSAYITDVGMVGAKNSVIGAQIEPILDRYLTSMPTRFEPEENGSGLFNAVIIEIDEKTGKAQKIERLFRITN